jgi:hypothetical protein
VQNTALPASNPVRSRKRTLTAAANTSPPTNQQNLTSANVNIAVNNAELATTQLHAAQQQQQPISAQYSINGLLGFASNGTSGADANGNIFKAVQHANASALSAHEFSGVQVSTIVIYGYKGFSL